MYKDKDFDKVDIINSVPGEELDKQYYNQLVNRKLGKKDLGFLVVIILIAIACVVWYRVTYRESGDQVQISVDGKVYGIYELNVNMEIPIVEDEVVNILVIENGIVSMKWADCPDQLCVHHKKIKATGETIVCLPNKVVVTVTGEKEPEFDAIAQ